VIDTLIVSGLHRNDSGVRTGLVIHAAPTFLITESEP